MAEQIILKKAYVLSKKKLDARAVTALAIKAVIIQKQSLDGQINQLGEHLAASDKSLAKALSFGVLRFYFSLEAAIQPWLKKPLRNKDFDVYALMLIGAYQLSAMRMPDYAALDSVVTASKPLKKPWAAGLINAVLRQYQKNQPDLSQHHQQAPWFAKKIQQAWPEQAQAIFAANNHEPPLCLRVNNKLISREAYAKKLEQAGFSIQLGSLSDTAIYLLDKPSDIYQVPGFAEGESSVQDEAAQMAAHLLNAQNTMRILDACAAPGGKTCHLLERAPDARLLALDIDEKRLQRVQENLDRLKLQAHLQAADITQAEQWWDGKLFDAILCDAPCSATGVIRRHPDIKFLRTAEDIEQLSQLQFDILQTLWPLLKEGGRLLYATCSVLPQENQQVIEKFCQQHSDCLSIGIALPSSATASIGWQLLPQIGGHDGFYYALLEKQHKP